MIGFDEHQNQECPKCSVKGFFSGICTECCEKIIKEKHSQKLKSLAKPLPCPFCNQPAELQIESHDEDLVFFSCSFYDSCTKNDSFDDVEDALRAWNTRGYTTPIIKPEREELITLIRSIEKLSLVDKESNLILINMKCKELLEKLTKPSE